MNILGIGPLELVLFILIALVVLGPDDIVKFSKKIGTWIRKMRKSDTWDNVVKMTDEVRKIPRNLMEETGIDEIKDDLSKAGKDIKKNFIDIEEYNRELNRAKLDIEKTIAKPVKKEEAEASEPSEASEA